MRKLLVAAALVTAAAPGRLHAQPVAADAPLQVPGPKDEPVRPQTPSASADAPLQIPGPKDEPGARADDQAPRRHRLFISPSGEPFRGPGGLAAWFALADADHDGAITPAEFQADALRAFKLYDANGDGVVDGFEIQAYERERVPEIGEIALGGDDRGRRRRRGGEGEGEEAGQPPGVGREGAARWSLLNEPQPLLAADENVDGKVSLAEWTHATARRFAALDRDHTGRLTLESLRHAPKKK